MSCGGVLLYCPNSRDPVFLGLPASSNLIALVCWCPLQRGNMVLLYGHANPSRNHNLVIVQLPIKSCLFHVQGVCLCSVAMWRNGQSSVGGPSPFHGPCIFVDRGLRFPRSESVFLWPVPVGANGTVNKYPSTEFSCRRSSAYIDPR